jgi:DNA-binding NarL/FixJ family response regulator
MSLRVILADDHALVRSGIRSLLTSADNVEVVAEASDGEEALRLAEALKPDIVVMDITMKGMNGLEATRRLKGAHPDIKILMLSMHRSEDSVVQALQAGARGYLLKDSAASELETAVSKVARGEFYLDTHVSKQTMERYLARVTEDGKQEELLTPRQREILQLIAEGSNTKSIAYRLNLSGKTVETHRAAIMERLGIRDVPGLVRYAIRIGITTSDQ